MTTMHDRMPWPEIIAEAGCNHDGSVTRACRLIDIGLAAGASSVKFQFIFPDNLYLPAFRDGKRLLPNPAHRQRMKEQMSEDQWQEVWNYAKEVGIGVSASVFCESGIDLLSRLGSEYVKIASTDLTNRDLVHQAAKSFDRVLLSTGMATLAEVSETVTSVQSQHSGVQLELLHCVSAYPCSTEDANPTRVRLLKDAFNVPVGYSDHTESNVSAVLALAQGAHLFEKHFTDDRKRPGFDHAHALEPDALSSYIQGLRSAWVSMVQGPNRNAPQELVTRTRARRGVYAARDLPAGHILTRADLLHVRPSSTETNLPSDLIGRRLTTDVRCYEALGGTQGVQGIASLWREASDYWENELDVKGMQSDFIDATGEE